MNKNDKKDDRASLHPERDRGPQKDHHPNQYGEQSEKIGITKRHN